MPDWVANITCNKCKKKGHLASNCPPKYNNQKRKTNQNKFNRFNKFNKPKDKNFEKGKTNNSDQIPSNEKEFAGNTVCTPCTMTTEFASRAHCNHHNLTRHF